MANITGTNGVDILNGAEEDDLIDGLSGSDTLSGGGGDDTILGGAGADTIDGGDGDDTITGGSGNDNLSGGAGDDIFVMNSGDGLDAVQGGDGDDRIQAGGPGAIISLRSGFGPANGIEEIVGGEGVSIAGSGGSDTYDFSSTILTDIENIDLGAGADVFTGSAGADHVTGGTGSDALGGGDGDDVLAGGLGTDSIDGGAGDDTIVGGTGNDSLVGGAGDDTFVIATGDGFDSIQGGDGIDRIVAAEAGAVISLKNGFGPASGIEHIVGDEGVTIAGGSGADTYDFAATELTGIENIDLAGGADVFNGSAASDQVSGGAGSDTLAGVAGDDTLDAGDGADTVSGGDGNDTIIGGAGNDALSGDAGDNSFVLGTGDGLDTIQGGEGDDRIVAAGPNTAITLKSGFGPGSSVESIVGDEGVTIVGSAGAEVYDFRGTTLSGIENIDLGGGADIFTGSDGEDRVVGGSGNDRLDGAAGIDHLTGGLNLDTFVISAIDAVDTVTDYSFADDRIELSILNGHGVTAGNLADFVAAEEVGSDTIVRVDTDGSTNGANFVDAVRLEGFTGPSAKYVIDGTVFTAAVDTNDPPTIDDQAFGIAETSGAGTVVGTAIATDPDDGDAVTFAITDGNASGAFAIDSQTGTITVADPSALDFETTPDFDLTVEVTDLIGLTDMAQVSVGLTNVNEVPTLADEEAGTVADSAAVDDFADVTGNLDGADVDADAALTYALGAGEDGAGDFGVLTVNADGSYSYAPDDAAINALADGASVSDEFQVQVTDEGGETAIATLTVALTGANDTPTLADEAAGTVVDTAAVDDFSDVTGALDGTDVDDGASLSYALGAGEDGASDFGTLTVNPDGSYSYAPNDGAINALTEGESVSDEFQVQVTDEGGEPATATLTVTLTGANDTPTLAEEAAGTVADTAALDDFSDVTGALDGADVDDGATLSYALGAGEDGVSDFGALTVNADGSYSYAPNDAAINALADGASVSDAFQVQVTDEDGEPATATLTVTLTGANDTPTLAEEAAGTVADTAALDDFSDVTGALDGADVDDGATLSYALGAGEDGVSDFGALTVNADGSYSYAPNDAAINALADGASVSDAFQVQVTDEGGETAIATLTVTLTGANDTPTVEDQTFAVAENSNLGTVVGSVAMTDVDAGDGATFAITAGNDGGTFAIDPLTGEITVADPAALDFETTPSFALTVEATDEGGLADTALVTVDLTNVNEAPSVEDGTFALDENSGAGTVVGAVAATDVDAGDGATFAITAGNDGGTFAIDALTGEITVADPAALDFETTPSFALTVEATDEGDLADTAVVTVDLANVNEAPVVDDQTFALDENSAAGTVVGSVAATDVDAGDGATFAITAGNDGGTFAIDALTGEITVADPAALDFETTPSFALTVEATDEGDLADTAVVTVDLTNVNEAPVVDDQTFALDENSAAGTVVGSVAATDVDAGDGATFAITAGNDGGTFAIDPLTGEITVANPAALDFETTPSFALTVEATDEGGLADTAVVTVDLANVNEAPVVDDQTFALAENSAAGTVVGSVAATDVDAGDGATFAITAGNDGGTFAIDPLTGEITVADPAALDFETTPSLALTVEATDEGGLADTAAVTVDLTDVAEGGAPPVVDDQLFSLAENSANGTVVGSIAATDPDAGDVLSYSITGGTGATAFAIDAATGELTVTDQAQLDFETTPSLTLDVQVSDDDGNSDTAAVTVDLTDVAEGGAPPVVDDQLFSLTENSANGTVVGSIAATDPDAGDVLSYSITGGTGATAFAIDAATGELTVTDQAQLDFETTPSLTLDVQVSDDDGNSDTAAVTVDLTDVAEGGAPPVVDDQLFSLAENSANGTVVGSIAATDPDAGDVLSYSITGGTGATAFAIDAATGELTVVDQAQLDFETTPSLTLDVQVSDDDGNSDTAAVTVNLTDVAEGVGAPPVVDDQLFSLTENSANGTVVGSIAATDPDAGDVLSYSITGGTGATAFAIDAATGELTVTDQAQLDFETTPSLTLDVQVSDDDGNSDTAAVTVDLTDVAEGGAPPVVDDQLFSLAENSANGTVVGSIAATDPDAGDVLSYSITGGTGAAAFAVDASTGQVTVASQSLLNFEATPSLTLDVQVTDTAGNPDTAAITINLTDVPEGGGAPPEIGEQTFGLAENSANGTVAGTVAATDPDVGDVLSFAITGGSGATAYAIDASTGQVTVADQAQLDFEENTSLDLNVRVTDNAGLTATAVVHVDLTDVAESGLVINGTPLGDTLIGDEQDNVINGLAGGDFLSGGLGNDTLIGGTDVDVLTGGTGDDLFVFANGDGQDTITDFAAGAGGNSGIDEVQLQGFSITEAQIAAALSNPSSQQIRNDGAGNVIIQVDASDPLDTITLIGVQKASLATSDFSLA